MTDRSLRAALISTDGGFRDQMRDLLAEGDLGVALRLEIHERFAAYGEEQVQAIRHHNPELMVIDLGDEPELGVKFIQFLAGTNPTQRVIAVGNSLSPDLLLAAMRAGVADYLTKPVTSSAIRDSLSRVTQSLGHSGTKQRRPGQVFTFFSPKGGSGVTSVATNIVPWL